MRKKRIFSNADDLVRKIMAKVCEIFFEITANYSLAQNVKRSHIYRLVQTFSYLQRWAEVFRQNSIIMAKKGYIEYLVYLMLNKNLLFKNFLLLMLMDKISSQYFCPPLYSQGGQIGRKRKSLKFHWKTFTFHNLLFAIWPQVRNTFELNKATD